MDSFDNWEGKEEADLCVHILQDEQFMNIKVLDEGHILWVVGECLTNKKIIFVVIEAF